MLFKFDSKKQDVEGDGWEMVVSTPGEETLPQKLLGLLTA